MSGRRKPGEAGFRLGVLVGLVLRTGDRRSGWICGGDEDFFMNLKLEMLRALDFGRRNLVLMPETTLLNQARVALHADADV
jgi:hypothetical protein